MPRKTGLSLDEIKDWRQFEDLVQQYFEDLKNYPGNSVFHVDAKGSGVGVDGGRDIIVKMLISDEVKEFERIWVVQCKFQSRPVSPSDFNEVNIPSLIHSYKADGYLLVCRSRPTSGTTNLFERLSAKCKNDYLYECWNETVLLKRLITCKNLHELFFPDYYAYMESKKEKEK